MIHVFGHRANGIQMSWFNGKHALQGNKTKSGLQTHDAATSCGNADRARRIRSKGHVCQPVRNRNRRTARRTSRYKLALLAQRARWSTKEIVDAGRGHRKFAEIRFSHDLNISRSRYG